MIGPNMPHAPTIRAAETTDLPRILDLNQAALPDVSSVTLADMEVLRQIAGYFHIIESGEQIAGFLIGLATGLDYASPNYRWFDRTYDDFFYVDRIVIADQAQGAGLGRALYRNVIDFARTHARRLTCEVNTRPANPRSMAFHDHFGFLQVGSQQTEGGDKEVAMLSLDLT